MLYSGSDDAGINRLIFNHSHHATNYLKVQLQSKALGTGQHARADFAICVNTETNENNATFANHRLFVSGSSGYIGIGTTASQNMLDLRPYNNTGNISIDPGTSSPGPQNGFMQICFNGGYNGGETRVVSGKTRYRMYCEQRSTNDYLGFDTYNSSNAFANVFGILPSGNMGINTLTPESRLHVYKSNADGNNIPGFLVHQTGNYAWGICAEFRTVSTGGDRPSILFSTHNGSTTWSVGYGSADDNFRIRSNHGHRNGGWGDERLRINTDGTIHFFNNTYHYGKIVVQNGQDGGSSRGIYMWTDNDSNWGIYMAQSGGGRSLSGGTACTGVYGFNSFAIRFRVANSSGNGFIFENSSEEHLMSIRGDDGHVHIAGNTGIGVVSPSTRLDVSGWVMSRDQVADDPSARSVLGNTANGSLMPAPWGSSLYLYGRRDNTNIRTILSASSYFTGQHGNKLIDSQLHIKQNLLDYVGLIVSSADTGYFSTNPVTKQEVTGKDAITISEALPEIKLTTTDEDKTVWGVITNHKNDNFNTDGTFDYDDTTEWGDRLGEKTVRVNGLGEGAIWVTNINGNIENGDYICSSVIPGYGRKQSDDILHNYTVAKITCSVNFDDIDLDEKFNIRYVKADGTVISAEEYNTLNEPKYKAAFVGCTYHCS
jgi:hypothetical protein